MYKFLIVLLALIVCVGSLAVTATAEAHGGAAGFNRARGFSGNFNRGFNVNIGRGFNRVGFNNFNRFQRFRPVVIQQAIPFAVPFADPCGCSGAAGFQSFQQFGTFGGGFGGFADPCQF